MHGHSGIRETILIVPRPGGRPRIRRGADIPITEAPIVPIQIADNERRLWLRSRDDRPSDKQNGGLELSVHFQQLPYGLDRVEYDSEGHVADYWYKSTEESELTHVRVARSTFLPKELEFLVGIWQKFILLSQMLIVVKGKKMPRQKSFQVLGIVTNFYSAF